MVKPQDEQEPGHAGQNDSPVEHNIPPISGWIAAIATILVALFNNVNLQLTQAQLLSYLAEFGLVFTLVASVSITLNPARYKANGLLALWVWMFTGAIIIGLRTTTQLAILPVKTASLVAQISYALLPVVLLVGINRNILARWIFGSK